jgi:hypothetical protein
MSFPKTLLLILTLAVAPVAAQPDRRVVAIGDIHGAYDEFLAILTQAKLIDSSQRWSGGRTTLVQTGDYTDRGAKVRQVLDLLMLLEESARRGGGQMITLAGNHEVLNMLGDLRYVTPEIAGTFADGESESRRERAWKDLERLVAMRGKIYSAPPPVFQQTREAWMAAHPPGWLEYREALGPRGRYGKWLRTKSIAATVDGALFMHAGISPDRPASMDDVNKQARQEIARYDAYLQRLVDAKIALPFFTMQEVLEITFAELQAASRVIEEAKAKNEAPDLALFNVPVLREGSMITQIGDWSLLAAEGPLWFRGYANWPEDQETSAKVTTFLDTYKLTRVVVGHTPTKDARIASRFGGRALVIDTGMLTPAYKGRPSALEIRGTQLSAIYQDGTVPLRSTSAPAIALSR